MSFSLYDLACALCAQKKVILVNPLKMYQPLSVCRLHVHVQVSLTLYLNYISASVYNTIQHNVIQYNTLISIRTPQGAFQNQFTINYSVTFKDLQLSE